MVCNVFSGKIKPALVLLFGVWLAACAGTGVSVRQSESAYLEELLKIKAQSEDADFLALRMAFVRTPEYQPYGGAEYTLSGDLFKAMEESEYRHCVEIANQLLRENYTSLNGHYAAMVCNMGLGNEETGMYHRYVLNGLMQSIGNSGDGRSPESAYIAISTPELRAFLRLIGLEINSQALVVEGGKSFDVMGVKYPKSGDEFEMTFDISIQMSKAPDYQQSGK